MKYPLLLRSILKYTPDGHSDGIKLEEAIDTIEDIIKLVDDKTGEAKCAYIKSKLEYLSDDQVSALSFGSQFVYWGLLNIIRDFFLYFIDRCHLSIAITDVLH